MNERWITPKDGEWSKGLEEMSPLHPPKGLFVRGLPVPAYDKCIAIVGSRRATATGLATAQDFARRVAEAGYCVVSGLAMGVDAAAHRGALEAGGRTVAVLGCGIDIAYPARNKDLKRQIEARGTVVTEYESGTPGYATNFPERNRIIAALSYGVLIVEGGFKSGALITARRAIDANRLVFAIPGSIRNPLAQGPNELIRAGEASLVTEVKHIFQEMAPQMVWTEAFDPLSRERPRLDPDDETLLLLFDDSPATVDALCRASGMELGRAAVALTRLEVRGFIRDGRAGYELTQSGARTRAAVFETHVPANH